MTEFWKSLGGAAVLIILAVILAAFAGFFMALVVTMFEAGWDVFR